MTLAVASSMNGLASTQYAVAGGRVVASQGPTQIAVQHVTVTVTDTVTGHRPPATAPTPERPHATLP